MSPDLFPSTSSLSFLATLGVLFPKLPVESLLLFSALACPGLPGAGDPESGFLGEIPSSTAGKPAGS